jgi:integrase
MARRVRNSDIETKQARRKLKQRGLPYWTRLEEGLHLGYRRQSESGKWVVRFYLGKDVRWVYRGKQTTKNYEKRVIGEADDFSDANGVTILDYDQAQNKARALRKGRVFAEAGIVDGPYTVRRAIDDYVQYLKSSGKEHRGARVQADAHILPELGEVEVASLTSDRIRKWLADRANTPVRRRTAPGEPQNFHKKPTTDKELRARKSSANRTFNIFRAALNFAFDEKRVATNQAWGRRVKPFRGVESKRDRYLEIDEARRLINASDPDFRELVQAALQTGCRFGEIIRLVVSDFKRDGGTLHVQRSKSGRERYVVLTDEGAAFFAGLCKGRPGTDVLLAGWNKTAVSRTMKKTLKRAKITPPITFHGLRHTYASLSIMAAVPLIVVAQNLGHADTRMCERHYGHLAKSFVADAIRAGAPRFGAVKATNVREIADGRR